MKHLFIQMSGIRTDMPRWMIGAIWCSWPLFWLTMMPVKLAQPELYRRIALAYEKSMEPLEALAWFIDATRSEEQ